jgi:hypothetical protein
LRSSSRSLRSPRSRSASSAGDSSCIIHSYSRVLHLKYSTYYTTCMVRLFVWLRTTTWKWDGKFFTFYIIWLLVCFMTVSIHFNITI